LYRKSLGLKAEYERLLEKNRKQRPEVDVRIGYDSSKGADREGVTINVTYNDRKKLTARLEELERVYKPYWELRKPIDEFLRIRFGLTRKLFFESRKMLDKIVEK